MTAEAAGVIQREIHETQAMKVRWHARLISSQSMSATDLHMRMCDKCAHYFPSQCAKRGHSGMHKRTAV